MCTCISVHQQPGCVCLHVCLCASVCVFVRCLCSMNACTSQVFTDFNGEMFGMSDICVPWDLLLLSEVIKGMKPADSSWRAKWDFLASWDIALVLVDYIHCPNLFFFFTISTFFPFNFLPSSCFLLVWVLNRVDYTVSLCGWNAALNL